MLRCPVQLLLTVSLASCAPPPVSDQEQVAPGSAVAPTVEGDGAEAGVAITALDEAEVAEIRDWIVENEGWMADLPDPEHAEPAFRAVNVDLNDDGINEILLRYDGFFQGTGGGGFQILARRPQGFVKLQEFSLGHLPIGILPHMTNGWHDLTVLMSGGGIRRPSQVRLMFDGTSYPDNPSMPPAKPTGLVGMIAISEDTPLVALPRPRLTR